MNYFQRKESKEIKYLMENWWITIHTPYKKLRRFVRKLNRETNV